MLHPVSHGRAVRYDVIELIEVHEDDKRVVDILVNALQFLSDGYIKNNLREGLSWISQEFKGDAAAGAADDVLDVINSKLE